MGFQELFYPRGAVIYGSMAGGKLGGILARQISEHGFNKLYAVNPKGLGIDAVKGYASLDDIGAELDLAVIAAPAQLVPQILDDCGRRGIKAAVIISSGFAEMGNHEGEQQLRQIAQQHGIRFIGPNCAGLLNTHHSFAPTLQAYPPQGGTAVISQSGAVGGAIMEWAQLHGLGVSKFVSYGNGADLNQVEFLQYLKDDAETRVAALYIENVEEGRPFMAALKELAAVKPVVVIKSGRTGTGQRAALSHTGSMAGSDAVYDAALRECGAIRVDSLDELIDLCKGFSYLPTVQGRKVAIVTNSGGPGVMTADLGEKLGMDICEPSPAVDAAMRQFLPAWAGFHNPIDMTVEGTGDNYRRVLQTTLSEYDAAVPIFFGPPYLDTRPMAEGILAAFKASGKPVAVAMETGLNAAQSVQLMREGGLPNFPSTERAIAVLARMAAHQEARSKKTAAPAQPAAPLEKVFQSRASLLEPEAMALLKANGIATPPFAFVTKREEIASACAKLGYPVALKVVSPQIIHKSDVGGVKLNIADNAAAQAAFDALAGVAAGLDFRGVIAYPMLKGGREVILGLTVDRQFGPVVAFGMGGVYTEMMKDIVLRVAPVNKETALDMVHEIKGAGILKGARGQAAIDFDALAEMIVRFSQLPYLYPDLREADLNPVFVSPEGAIVADARLLGAMPE